MRHFTLDKKMVVQVRYYEYMYVIRDKSGERVYTGTDAKLAKTILTLLNGYYGAKVARRKLRVKKVKKVKVKKRKKRSS